MGAFESRGFRFLKKNGNLEWTQKSKALDSKITPKFQLLNRIPRKRTIGNEYDPIIKLE